jgi:hypothetical protein
MHDVRAMANLKKSDHYDIEPVFLEGTRGKITTQDSMTISYLTAVCP